MATGPRLLFLASPYQRGDDVAELQIRLAQLGFNPGRIDGIFGPMLEGALIDFQRNCALETCGALTRATLVDLLRLSAVVAGRHLVTEARDHAGFNEGANGPVVLCGAGELLGFVARALAGVVDLRVLDVASPEAYAAAANALDATVVLSFQSVPALNGVHLHYWASYRSHSHQGDRVAGEIATALARTATLPRVEVTGMALPILRETRMTTLARGARHPAHERPRIHRPGDGCGRWPTFPQARLKVRHHEQVFGPKTLGNRRFRH